MCVSIVASHAAARIRGKFPREPHHAHPSSECALDNAALAKILKEMVVGFKDAVTLNLDRPVIVL